MLSLPRDPAILQDRGAAAAVCNLDLHVGLAADVLRPLRELQLEAYRRCAGAALIRDADQLRRVAHPPVVEPEVDAPDAVRRRRPAMELRHSAAVRMAARRKVHRPGDRLRADRGAVEEDVEIAGTRTAG